MNQELIDKVEWALTETIKFMTVNDSFLSIRPSARIQLEKTKVILQIILKK